MKRLYYPVIDAMLYIMNIVSGSTVRKNAETYKNDHPDVKDQILSVIDKAVMLEDIISASVSIDSPLFDFYFSQDIGGKASVPVMSSAASLLLSYLAHYSPEAYTVDETIEAKLSVTKKQKMTIFSGNGLINSFAGDEELDRIIGEENEEALLRFMTNMDISAPMKRKIFSLYRNYDEHIRTMLELMRPIVDLIIANEPLYGDCIRDIEDKISRTSDVRRMIGDSCGMILPESDDCSIYLNLFDSTSITLHESTDRSTLDVYVGVFFEKMTNLFYHGCDSNKLASCSKALADSVRIEILQAICATPRYGLELAEMFDISASMVSYHMSKLALNGFVESTLRDGKVYYTVRMDNIEVYVDNLKRFLKSPYIKRDN